MYVSIVHVYECMYVYRNVHYVKNMIIFMLSGKERQKNGKEVKRNGNKIMII